MSYSAELYRHELDKKAFDALNMFPTFVKFREAYIANVDEKQIRIEFLSQALRLSENQYPEIYKLLPPICEKLGINVPELYFIKSKKINAFTMGNTEPVIVVTSKLIEKVPHDKISAILAHECGHIACKHCLYHSMAGLIIDKLEDGLLSRIPAVRRYVTPALISALKYWDRCSELSADRAATLCTGNADDMIDSLLAIYEYEDVNRDEFIKQALDLKEYVNASKANKSMEFMLTCDETHPRLATRAYSCYDWVQTEQFKGILNGTYKVQKNEDTPDTVKSEVASGEIKIILEDKAKTKVEDPNIDVSELNAALERVNKELDRYTNKADKGDYAFAIFSGIMAGAIDSLFVDEMKITDKEIGLSHKQVNNFIQKYAEKRGFKNERLKDAIADLEGAFKVAQDNVWKGAGIGVAAKNHHLADLAHHPTPLGLVSSIIVQFLRIGTFVNKDGEWHLVFVDSVFENGKQITSPGEIAKNILEALTPAIITGILNWLVMLAENKAEENGEEISPALHRIVHLVASTPMIVEIAKCADNWFGHLVSDMGGSKNTAGGGMGIPGLFISLLYEMGSLPVLKNTGLLAVVDDLYQKQKMDLRHEVPLYKELGMQALPVLFNEVYIRLSYFLVHFAEEVLNHPDFENFNWQNVIPFNNRTVDRMLMISTMTFNIADTADAAVHAAIESAGNWVVFSGKFVSRYNYIGAGKAAFAIVKEISNERKETQLIHEKMLLTEAKTEVFIYKLQEFKAELDEKLSNYLAEDIESFMNGFDYMDEGFKTGNSDLVIKGNVVIQKVLGREPQFTTQKEFDDLMESDNALKL